MVLPPPRSTLLPYATRFRSERLKYLEFVHTAAIHAIGTFANLYVYAKEKAGPLKPGVDSVEGTVKSVVGPVYDKFHDVPIELLKFVDRKVDESVTGLDRHVPPVVKQVSSQGVKETASGIAKNIYAKYEPKAKELYNIYEPKAEQCAVSTWRKLNSLPLFPQVAQIVVPTAAYCSEKYNQTVMQTAQNGYRVSSYLPLVPTEKIAKIFASEEPESTPLASN